MVQVLALAASVLFILRLLALVALHVRPGGVHPVRHAVSDYAASSAPGTRRLAAAASWLAAAAWAVLGIVVLTYPAASEHTGLGVWLLVLAVVLAVMPRVPTDGAGQPTTARGRLHLLLAVAWFAIAYSTIGPESRMLAEATGAAVPGILPVLHVIAAIALVSLVVSLLVPALRERTFGISERVFILAVTLAPLIVGAGLAAA